MKKRDRSERRSVSLIMAALALISFAVLPVYGDKVFDGGPSGTGTDWDTAANWSPDGVPNAERAQIGANHSVSKSSGSASVTHIEMGYGGTSGILNVDGGGITVTTELDLGRNSALVHTGTVNITAGSLTVAATKLTRIGFFDTTRPNAHGALNISGGTYAGHIVHVGGQNGAGAGAGTLMVLGTGAISASAAGDLNIYAEGTLSFVPDASGVTTFDVGGTLNLYAGSTLTVDLSAHTLTVGHPLVLVDYASRSGSFTSIHLIGGTGVVDYAYDQGGADMAVALKAAPLDLSGEDAIADSELDLPVGDPIERLAEYAFDNDHSSRWSSAPANSYPDWICVRLLGDKYFVEQVDIDWNELSTPGSYELFVSDAGSNPGGDPAAAGWQSIGTMSSRTGTGSAADFDEEWDFATPAWNAIHGTGTASGLTRAAGKYLLIYATLKGGSNGLTSIHEIDVYATLAPKGTVVTIR